MVEQGNTRGSGNHHVVVIGASAGGLQVLAQLLSELPKDLPASVFAVMHVGASSHLAQVLSHASTLPVLPAKSGRVIEPGHVYVAVPGAHMLIHDSHLLLRRGPRENFARPAIDPLFRSAACTFGGAVIGVVLSGALSDGTSGLRAIKRCGGLTVVQDPSDAAVPSMPRAALRAVCVDHVAKAAELGQLLDRLVRTPAAETPPIPAEIRLETAIAAHELASMQTNEQLGTPSRFICPECHGGLWEIEDGGPLRFRCHVGHAYNGDTILVSKGNDAETMLWKLLRTHQERAALARRMAAEEKSDDRLDLANTLLQRAHEYDEDAEIVRRLLENRTSPSEELDEHGSP